MKIKIKMREEVDINVIPTKVGIQIFKLILYKDLSILANI